MVRSFSHVIPANAQRARRGYSLIDLLLWMMFAGLVLGFVTTCYREFHGADNVVALAVSANGRVAAALVRNGEVRVWDVASGRQTAALRLQQADYLFMLSCRLSSDGGRVQVIDGYRYQSSLTRTAWDLTPSPPREIANLGGTQALAYDVDSDYVVQPAPNNDLAIVRLQSNGRGPALVATIPFGAAAASHRLPWLAFAPGGRRIAICGGISGIHVCDLPSGKLRCSIPASQDAWNGKFSPDGSRFVYEVWTNSGSPSSVPGSNVIVVDATSGRQLCRIASPSYQWNRSAFSADGRLLALASSAGVEIVEADGGQARGFIDCGPAAAVAFVPGENAWLVADSDRIALWDADTLTFRRSIWNSRARGEWWALGTAFIVWLVLRTIARRRRMRLECFICGKPASFNRKFGQPLCPRCVAGRYSFTMNWRLFRLAFGLSLGAILVIAGVLSAMPSGGPRWLTEGVALCVVFLLVLTPLLLPVLRQLRACKRLQSESRDLALARRLAGHEGTLLRCGTTSIWLAPGTTIGDDLPRLLDASRQQVSNLLGLAPSTRSLRTIVWQSAADAQRYLLQHRVDLPFLSCLYIPGRIGKIVLCEEQARLWLETPQLFLSCGLVFYHLADRRRLYRRAWMVSAANGLITYASRPEVLARLNRMMLASLARGTALDARMFRLSTARRAAMIGNWYVHEHHAAMTQFGWQAWSMTEFLLSTGEPTDRRMRLHAFLADVERGQAQEPAFKRHFGFGYAQWLDAWREWVREQGVGGREAPDAERRHTILGVLVPLARNHEAKFRDRLFAVRSLGNAGYLLGADTLIDLLADPNSHRLLKLEAAWALAMIAGESLGDEPQAWRAWWDAQPLDERA